MTKIERLSTEALYQCCEPEMFDFETTEALKELTDIIGQSRAVEALRFGINIDQEGYNIFAVGLTGTGKRSLVRRLFEARANEEAVPDDWCYINNFEQRHKPRALRLPPGKGETFRQDMESLVQEIDTALSSAFESDEYQARRQEIEQAFQERQQEALETIDKQARDQNITLLRTSSGLAFAPVQDGEIVSPEELEKMSEEEQEQLKEKIQTLQEALQASLRQGPRWQREMQEQLRDLNREFATFAIGGLMDELREKYSDLPKVVAYLDDVRQDIIDNVREFLTNEDGQEEGGQAQESALLRRYRVNLIIDRREAEAAPVIFEDNPTYQNLIGRVEHISRMGTLITDFNLIKPGALHQANGGYLILEARKLLTEPFAWDGLKRALQAAQIRIESPAQSHGLISTVTLEPEPIPLRAKVALLGEPRLYYLLSALDPEFGQLFKVTADFAERMARDANSQTQYAQLIARLVHKAELRPFDRSAVARVIEHSARLAGDAAKLSTRIREITDLLREADYWAGQAEQPVVRAEDVQQAIQAQIYRSDRPREQIQEAIERDTILIDTSGEKVGQVNGLSVLQLGSFAFGRPNRITARVRLGEGKVVDIEREVELGGPIHSKGVLILSGFLGARYATDQPLSLSASLVFEQSYGGVEGDSASSGELYALLSAIAEVPLKQSLAVTGSVNQHGQVQAIGGVNEKIEGFFDLCRARGLTGEQGVLIPHSNIKHLMLRQDVIDAVAEEQFHIYPVQTVDQGIELLTGLPAGTPDEAGDYPAESLNGRVQARLTQFADRRLAFAKSK